MKKILFIDRDGILLEEPADEQVDSLSKVKFPKGMFSALSKVVHSLDYKLVMVTNQDGLGTDSYPESDFWPYQELLIRSLAGEGVEFDEICIDRSFEKDNSKYRKPETGLLTKYLNGKYDLENSFVIGDRWSDMQLASNLGCKGIWLHPRENNKEGVWRNAIVLKSENWEEVYTYLIKVDRKATSVRNTNETKISASINLDGSGVAEIKTGLSFFNHMLDQIARHGDIDLTVNVNGDLEVDEHHTIEDTAIALGEIFNNVLAKKAGITRYGYALPMDDCKAQVLLDFGGRPWLVWDVEFEREKIGDVPTEMWYHFFKSFCDHAKCNLNISAEGKNEHHKIESIFKAFARAIKMAKKRNENDYSIPSTKGNL